MNDLETYLTNYRPLLNALSKNPFMDSLGKPGNRIYWYTREREELEMYAEDTFIQLYMDYDNSRNVDFEGYMNKIIRYRMHHFAWKLLKQRDYNNPLPEYLIHEQAAAEEEPDVSLEQYESLLTPRQYQVLLLTYDSLMKPREIAELLGIPRQNVYSHLRAIHQKINLETSGD